MKQATVKHKNICRFSYFVCRLSFNAFVPREQNVHLVGDADHVGNLRTVIWRAWDVAMKL